MMAVADLLMAVASLWIFHKSNNPLVHCVYLFTSATLLSSAFMTAKGIDHSTQAKLFQAVLWGVVLFKIISIRLETGKDQTRFHHK